MDQGYIVWVVLFQACESGLISWIASNLMLQSDSSLGLENKLCLFMRVDLVFVAARLRRLELGSILDITKWLSRSRQVQSWDNISLLMLTTFKHLLVRFLPIVLAILLLRREVVELHCNFKKLMIVTVEVFLV